MKLADDIVVLNTLDGGDRLFSRRMACPSCDISIPEMTPRAFSFNSPHGACPNCQGLGAVYDFDPGRVIPDDRTSLAEGAVVPWGGSGDGFVREMLDGLARTFGIDPTVPFAKLPKKLRDIVLFGAPGRRTAGQEAKRRPAAPAEGAKPASKRRKTAGATKASPADPYGLDFEGVIPNLRRRFEDDAWTDQESLEPFRSLQPCPACDGGCGPSRAVRVEAALLAMSGCTLASRRCARAGRSSSPSGSSGSPAG